MATSKKAEPAATGIRIDPVVKGTVEVAILGVTPLIQHRMAAKAMRELLFPAPTKTRADKAANLKHDPLAEFRDAAEILADGPSYLGLRATAFKGALKTAALDLPGSTKAQVGRLVYIEGEYVPVFGIPKVSMDVVRMADAKKTPDVRTRPILPRWAALVRVTFVRPLMDERSILNLINASGVTAGVGDFRQEKGGGSFGQYRIVPPDDAEWLDVMAEGREAQMKAMADPEPYDATTAELLGWFTAELDRRGRKAA